MESQIELIERKNGKIFTRHIVPKHGDIDHIDLGKECEFFEYYDNEKLKIHYFKHNSLLDGEYTSFFDDGELELKCTFKEGKFVGKYEEHYKNHQIRRSIEFIASDKIINMEDKIPRVSFQQQLNNGGMVSGFVDGDLVEFYENGHPKSWCHTVDCKMERDWTEYYENGGYKSRKIYKNGRMNGRCDTFYESGKLKETCIRIDDLIEGELTEYYENDILKLQKFYKNNECEGKCLMKYDNDKLFATGYYRSNKAFGEWIIYERNEQIKFKGFCVKDIFYAIEYMDININLLIGDISYDKLVGIYKVNEEALLHKEISLYKLIRFIDEETDYEVDDIEDNTCMICRSSSDDIVNLGCDGENKHGYHLDCLIKWFITQENENIHKCPCCMKEINWKLCKKIKVKPKTVLTEVKV